MGYRQNSTKYFGLKSVKSWLILSTTLIAAGTVNNLKTSCNHANRGERKGQKKDKKLPTKIIGECQC